jgi:TfoX/Sxy family transcriptional regulator of competence genes
VYIDIKSKYLDKGLYAEEDVITTEVDGVFYVKNDERKSNANHTGECDI